MLRAVLDANVLVAARIQPRGAPGRILEALLEGAFEMVVTAAILNETRRALFYPKVRKRLFSTDEELDRWVAALGLVGIPVRDIGPIGAEIEDPDDEKYLAAAIEGRAAFVVSGDRHLLALGRFRGIPILPPAAFLRLLV